MRCSSSLTSLREQIRLDEGTAHLFTGRDAQDVYRPWRSLPWEWGGDGDLSNEQSARAQRHTIRTARRAARTKCLTAHSSATTPQSCRSPATSYVSQLSAWRLEILGIGARARAVEMRSGMAVGQ